MEGGFGCEIPETIRKAALLLPGDFLIDREAVGDHLHVFDLLDLNGKDLRSCWFSTGRPKAKEEALPAIEHVEQMCQSMH